MRLNEEVVEIIQAISLDNTFRKIRFQKLLLNMFRASGLPRRYQYKDLQNIFYLKNFEGNKNPMYDAISAALYSFSILLTLLTISGATEKEQLHLSKNIAQKMAEKTSQVLIFQEKYSRRELQKFLSKSFYLSLLAQMKTENSKILIEAMFYLHDLEYTKGILHGDKNRSLKNCGTVKLQNREEADVFQFLANILEPICRKKSIPFDRYQASNNFNNFIVKNFDYPINPGNLQAKAAIVYFAKPFMFFMLAVSYWKNHVSLPYAALGILACAWGYKYIVKCIGKIFDNTLTKGITDEKNRLESYIKTQQDFLVAEYEQEQEEKQITQPLLLFTPMRTEEATLTFPKYTSSPGKLYTQKKPKKRKSSQEAHQEQERHFTRADSIRPQAALPAYHYLTNYRNQVVIINPDNITRIDGRELNKLDLQNIACITRTARLCLYKTTHRKFIKFDCKIKRGHQSRTSPRLFANRTVEKIYVEGRGMCQVYEALVYSPTH